MERKLSNAYKIMRQLYVAILLLVLSSSCDEETFTSPSTASDLITFGVKLTDSSVQTTTKGAKVEEAVDMKSFGVYCANTDTVGWSVATAFEKLYNQQLYYLGGEWVYDGETATWDRDATDKYTFYAYSPYATDDNGIEPTMISGALVIDYTMPLACTYQPDLMVATPIKDIVTPTDGNVALSFRHALSAVGFNVVGDSAHIIKSISLRNIIPSARLTIGDSGELTWQNFADRTDVNYTASIDNGVLPDLYTPTALTLDSGYLMVVPQSIEDVVVYVEVYDSDSEETTTKSFSFASGEAWEAGEAYQYTINLASYDYTIEGTANCYMLHPTGETQTFYIPVEGRINSFWRYYADDKETYKDKLSSADVWGVEVLWHDVESGVSGFSAERVTSGFSPSERVTIASSPDFTTLGTRSAMKITLPATLTEGNILLGVTFNDEILWSWHLWITDYDPDAIVAQVSPIDSQYSYSIAGANGDVHRYEDNDLWGAGGIYEDKFIMDRNLGARSVDYSDGEMGVLHYQFGRKDPFPVTTVGGSVSLNRKNEQVSFLTAAQNPTVFYTRSSYPYSWSIEGEVYSDSYLWDDKSVPNTYGQTSYKKPFFDPSPLGWKIPIYGTYVTMNSSNCELSYSKDELVYNGVVKLPYTGFRSNNSGNVGSYGSQGNLRLATARNSSAGYNLAYSSYITVANNTRADGFAIRCIEE